MTHVCPHCSAILLPDERICPICGEGKDTAPKAAEATSADTPVQAGNATTSDALLTAMQPTRRSVFAPIGAVAAIAACAALALVAYQSGMRHPSAPAHSATTMQSVAAHAAGDSEQTPLLFSVHSKDGQAGSSQANKPTQQSTQQPAVRGGGQPVGATYNAVTSQPAPGQSQPATSTDASAPSATPPPGGGGAAPAAQADPKQTQLAAMDQQLTDARARITQMTDARTQVNDRMQQLQANPPPDGAAILRRQYDQQVQALQQNLEQMQAAIDAAQSSVDALQQQRDRMAGP